jgi:hypothetical protein
MLCLSNGLTALQAAVKRLLSDSEEAVREDVGPLIKTVVATNKFEREMAAMFGGGAAQDDDDDLQVCGCSAAVVSSSMHCITAACGLPSQCVQPPAHVLLHHANLQYVLHSLLVQWCCL